MEHLRSKIAIFVLFSSDKGPSQIQGSAIVMISPSYSPMTGIHVKPTYFSENVLSFGKQGRSVFDISLK